MEFSESTTKQLKEVAPHLHKIITGLHGNTI